LIVGSGPQESELRQLAAKSKGIVEFAGEIEQSQLPKLINSSRFFVLNSKYEGSPHSLIEAMSCGALVIARASTGTKELIESGVDGILVVDHEKLANVLKSCIGDQKTRLNMGVKAREKILRNYSREKIFSDIYRLTVQNK
jgi:glycosyltransferase involved in cell wall biosynthesis